MPVPTPDPLSWVTLKRFQQTLAQYRVVLAPCERRRVLNLEEATLLIARTRELSRDLSILRQQMCGDIMSDSLVLLDAYDLVMIACHKTFPGCVFIALEAIDEGDSDPETVLGGMISVIDLLTIELYPLLLLAAVMRSSVTLPGAQAIVIIACVTVIFQSTLMSPASIDENTSDPQASLTRMICVVVILLVDRGGEFWGDD